MISNRNLTYNIRKYMPDISFIHNTIANRKLANYRRLLLPQDLVSKGEREPDRIPSILNEVRGERSGQMKGLVSFFDRYLKTWQIPLEGDLYEKTRDRMLFDCMSYGFAPDEFSYYELMKKSPEEKRAYSTDLDRKMMQYQLSDFKDLMYVFDKTATYEKFAAYYKRDAISVATERDYDKFKSFAMAHDEMVIKAVSASSGHGVRIEKADREDLKGQFERILSQGKCSIEERISQSDLTGCINPSSVNTARIMTFNIRQGIIIGPCFFRAGRAGSEVDNGGSGGIMVGLDGKTGVLDSDGYDEYPRSYETHPDSGIRFKGFALPDWDTCIGIVREMAGQVPRLGFVGWDMAYTRDAGWVIVEANGGSHIMTQLMYQKGCKEEIEGYMKDMKHYGR